MARADREQGAAIGAHACIAQGFPGRSARRFRLACGRLITYCEFGTADGFPVLALHGTPGSRFKYAAADEDARRAGLRLISPDRWGYGGSDSPPYSSLSAYADDMRELLDGLGIGRFSVVGISGGGPYAVAAAARLGRRVAALALIAPVGPIAGTIEPSALNAVHRFCFRRLPRFPRMLRAAFQLYRQTLAIAPKTSMRVATLAAAPVDKALVRTPGVRDHLYEAFRAGLERGVGGPLIDLHLFSMAWLVPFEAIDARTRIWLGTEDRNVPQAAVEALAGKIGEAELTRLPGQGHFWISRHYGEVLAWLAEAR
jgi:pimeloyl-ACP methyl ester carboxylesterase